MKITKGILAEQIKRILESYEISSQDDIDERELMLAIDQVADHLAAQGAIAALSRRDKTISSNYKAEFKPVSVEKEEDTGRYFATLPARPISLEHNKGIDLVAPLKAINTPFACTPNHFASISANLPVGQMQGRKSFTPQGNKIFFNDDPGVTELYIRLVISGSAQIDPEAEFPISPEEQIMLVDEVVKRYMSYSAKPNDRTSDGNE